MQKEFEVIGAWLALMAAEELVETRNIRHGKNLVNFLRFQLLVKEIETGISVSEVMLRLVR